MSISSSGLYGSATIVSSDLFNDVWKEQETTLWTSYLTTTQEHRDDISQNRLDVSQNRQDISSNLSRINDLSDDRIKDIEGDITDISNNRITDVYKLMRVVTEESLYVFWHASVNGLVRLGRVGPG